MNESQLPPVLDDKAMAQLLGMSLRTMQKRRKGRGWPFTEMPRLDRKPRWSREHVLSVINGQRVSTRR